MDTISVGLKEAQKHLGVSEFTLRRWLINGKLKCARIGRRILIPVSELARLAKPAEYKPFAYKKRKVSSLAAGSKK